MTIHARLNEFLEMHNILYENQFGFGKNNSTIFALIQITEKIKESIDKGKFGCGIFIDLSKAFDTVKYWIFTYLPMAPIYITKVTALKY